MRITGGTARGVRLIVPQALHVRPTSDRVRGALFQLVGQAVEGAVVLDLYAGTGALGIEALSRGAARVDFVEQDSRMCRVIQQNLESTGFEDRGHVSRARVAQALQFLKGPYDLVVMDPPYEELQEMRQAMEALGRASLLNKGAMVVLESSSRAVLEDRYGALHSRSHRRYGDSALSIYSMEDT